MKNLLLSVFSIVCLILSFSNQANAHESFHWMQSVEKDRMLVVFYNLDDFQENIEQTFQLRLVELSNGRSIPFKYADISFEANGESTHSFRAKPDENNDIEFSYAFPDKGKFILSVELYDDKGILKKTIFPILVGEGVEADIATFINNYFGIIILVLTFVIFISYLAGYRKMHIYILSNIQKIRK